MEEVPCKPAFLRAGKREQRQLDCQGWETSGRGGGGSLSRRACPCSGPIPLLTRITMAYLRTALTHLSSAHRQTCRAKQHYVHSGPLPVLEGGAVARLTVKETRP